jgi:hypothetical protein
LDVSESVRFKRLFVRRNSEDNFTFGHKPHEFITTLGKYICIRIESDYMIAVSNGRHLPR